jgi:hypothetical protein
MLGISRQHLHEILEEKKPVSPTGSASLSATGRPSGFACRQLTVPGMQSARGKSVDFTGYWQRHIEATN